MGISNATQNLYDVGVDLIADIKPRYEHGYKENERRSYGVDVIGKPTGFDDLDYALGGWRNDEMYSLAGASGSGKSAMALSVAFKNAEMGANTFYVSLEMSAKMLALRLLAAMTGLPAMNIEKGNLKEESMELVSDSISDFKRLPLSFFDGSMASDDLINMLDYENKRIKDRVDMCVVDYLGLFKDKGSPYERMTNIADTVRLAARQHDLSLVAVAQINRASLDREDGRPKMQDLKDSGQVEANSAAVIFPFRPNRGELVDETNYEEAELIIDKNRYGPTGIFRTRFYPKLMVWQDDKEDVLEPKNLAQKVRSIA